MEHPPYEDLTQWCGGQGLPRCLLVGDLVGRELQRDGSLGLTIRGGSTIEN
jgi:hypothetical protein